MPTYAYKCKECEIEYEVFHKVREETKDIICPSCNSTFAKKMITAPNIGISTSSFGSVPEMPSCASSGCSSGMCGLN